jgi:hypothetical protein
MMLKESEILHPCWEIQLYNKLIFVTYFHLFSLIFRIIEDHDLPHTIIQKRGVQSSRKLLSLTISEKNLKMLKVYSNIQSLTIRA